MEEAKSETPQGWNSVGPRVPAAAGAGACAGAAAAAGGTFGGPLGDEDPAFRTPAAALAPRGRRAVPASPGGPREAVGSGDPLFGCPRPETLSACTGARLAPSAPGLAFLRATSAAEFSV